MIVTHDIGRHSLYFAQLIADAAVKVPYWQITILWQEVWYISSYNLHILRHLQWDSCCCYTLQASCEKGSAILNRAGMGKPFGLSCIQRKVSSRRQEQCSPHVLDNTLPKPPCCPDSAHAALLVCQCFRTCNRNPSLNCGTKCFVTHLSLPSPSKS